MPRFSSAEELYAVIRRMITALQANEAFRTKIAQTEASVGFNVTDLNAEFNLRFSKGEVSGGPGSSKDCTIAVSLTSSVLDNIFSGKQDPESAYTYGSLSLRGSEYTAESMLRFMHDIIAAYKVATA